MFVTAITETYVDTAELVALCDLSQVRMNWYNRQLQGQGLSPLPTYHADDFAKMIAERKPHTLIVTTVDAWHHQYIVRAMEMGCDVICEKPMTTTLERLHAIKAAIERSGKIAASDIQLPLFAGFYPLPSSW